MHIFVTGATGQIGLPLVVALIGAGHTVAGLGRCKKGLERLAATGATAIEGSLEDGAGAGGALAQGLAGAEAVFHLAGGVRGRGKATAEVLNHQGSRLLLDAIRQHAPGLKKLIFASTCAVYGDRNGLWVTEDYAPAPHTEYGASKLAAEKLLLGSGVPTCVARIAAVYGPGFRMMQVGQMQRGRALLPGEGQNFLPLIHIDDCTGALLRLLDAGEPGRIYHVAAPATLQLREFYKLVHARAGGRPLRFWSTWIPGAIQKQAAALNERLQTALNRKPRLTNDALKLWTAGVRLKTERLEKELSYTWKWPEHKAAIAACFPPT